MPTERELKDAIDGKLLPAVQDESSTALTLAPSQAWESTYKYSLKEIHGIAKTACAANIFTNTADASKAVVRIFWGLENGLTPMEALNDVYESKGRFYIFGDGVVTQLAKRGAHVVYTETSPKVCTGHIEDDTGKVIGLPVTVTIEQAAAMGVLDKPAWRSDPESMLCARVVSRLNKRVGKRFWQTTVGVREEAEDIEWVERANAKEDPATKAIASAGRRRAKPEAAEVETVEDPKDASTGGKDGSLEDGAAETVVKTQNRNAAIGATTITEEAQKTVSTKPKTLPAKERVKLASPAQQAEMIKAIEETGIEEKDIEAYWRDEHGINDDNFDQKMTVEVYQATMLHIQGIIEGVRE